MNYNLERFLQAQEEDYETALAEIRQGRKRSHWMWYIFPQLRGLGNSSMAQRYGISGIEEATAYLRHPVLGKRLIQITEASLNHVSKKPLQIFGHPDNLKFHSSVTLFAQVPEADGAFRKALEVFFDGKPDDATLRLLA